MLWESFTHIKPPFAAAGLFVAVPQVATKTNGHNQLFYIHG